MFDKRYQVLLQDPDLADWLAEMVSYESGGNLHVEVGPEPGRVEFSERTLDMLADFSDDENGVIDDDEMWIDGVPYEVEEINA